MAMLTREQCEEVLAKGGAIISGMTIIQKPADLHKIGQLAERAADPAAMEAEADKLAEEIAALSARKEALDKKLPEVKKHAAAREKAEAERRAKESKAAAFVDAEKSVLLENAATVEAENQRLKAELEALKAESAKRSAK